MRNARKWLVCLLVAGLGLVAAGCGMGAPPAAPPSEPPGSAAAPGDEPAAPKEKVRITFWHAMNMKNEQGQALDHLVRQFMAQHPEYQVEHLEQGSYGDLNKKLMAATAAGEPPTMAQLTDDVMVNLWNAQQLAALDPLVADPNLGLSQTDLADFPDFFLEATRAGGNQIAWPFARSTQVIIYDRGLIPNPPQTWDKFRQIAKAVTRDTNGDGTPDIYGTAFKPTVDYLDLFIGGSGGRWMAGDGRTPAFNSPEAVAALQLIVDMVQDGSAMIMPPKAYQSDIFNEGRAAMVATTSASLPFIHTGSDGVRDWAVAPLFAGPGGNKTPFFGNNLGVFAAATPQQQRGAWLLIKFLTNTESTAYWATKTGYVPVRFSALQHPIWLDFKARHPNDAVPAEQLGRGTFQPALAEWYNIRTDITTAVEAAVQGTMSVQEALDQAAKKAASALAKGTN